MVHLIKQTMASKRDATLRTITAKAIESWQKDGAEIEQELLDRMEKIFAAKESVEIAKRKYSEAMSEKSEITSEQKRLTELIRVLKADSPTAEKYLAKLSESETDLEKTNEKVRELKRLFDIEVEKLESLYE